MGLESEACGSESRFAAYVEAITSALGHADRAVPFRSYCAGLLLPGDRKSVEPIAARLQPGRVQATHQSLHHFVAKSEWSDDTVLAAVRARVLPIIERHGKIRALIIDDTGMPKKGKPSVGVARQYCGQLGKQDNCQVAVSLSAANDHASLPVAYRLYLPHQWVDDPVRGAEAGIPRRTRANEILSVHAAREHQRPGPGERHEATLADRAQLSGPQTGARAWPLRRARVAWLSSSRHTVHRRIRIPDLRNGSDSPPQDQATPFSSKNIAFPQVIDPADPPIRPERHVATSITSLRTVIARAIARVVPRCPCCQRITRRSDL